MSAPARAPVLAATDLSPGGEAALRLGAAWAEREGRPLEAVLVAAPEERPALAELESALARALGEAAGEPRGEAPRATVIADADVPGALRRAAARGSAIVIGCEGASATFLRRAGRVASALAGGKDLAVPVLLAPPGWRGPGRPRRRSPAGLHLRGRRAAAPPPAFARVMAGLDATAASDRSDRALLGTAAAVLARAPEPRRLALAAVVGPDAAAARHHPGPARALLRDAGEVASGRAEDALRALLLDELPFELATACATDVHVLAQGPVERDLAGLAASQEADLLVVGAGPVAARLVGFARCPVLVAPRP